MSTAMRVPPPKFYQLCRLCLSSTVSDSPCVQLFDKCLQSDNSNALVVGHDNANGVIIDDDKVTTKRTTPSSVETGAGNSNSSHAAHHDNSAAGCNEQDSQTSPSQRRADGLLEGGTTKNSSHSAVLSPLLLSSSSLGRAGASESEGGKDDEDDNKSAAKGLSSLDGNTESVTTTAKETTDADDCNDCETAAVNFMRNESSKEATTTNTTEKGGQAVDSLFLFDNNKSDATANVAAGKEEEASIAMESAGEDFQQFGEVPQRILTCLAIKVRGI